jgi:hypothetical protein
MAGVVQTTGAFLINGFDATSYLKSVERNAEQDILDCTTLGVTNMARTYQPGLASRTVSAEGLWSVVAGDATTSIDKEFGTALSSTAHPIVTIGDVAPVIGGPAYMYNLVEAKYSIKEVVGDLVMAQFEGKATDQTNNKSFATGVWLMTQQAVTATVNGTSYDSTSGGTGYMAQCHVTDGSALLTVKIQHSTDNSSWSDLVSFTAFTVSSAEQKFSTVTSVNRYVRGIVSAFSGTSALVSVAIKIGYTG